MANLSDVAKAAGVSMSAASKVINGERERWRISEESARRVLEAAEALNYRPNMHARWLRKGGATAVGVLIQKPHTSARGWDPFIGQLLGGIDSHARLNHHEFLIIGSSSTADAAEIDVALDYFAAGRLDGLIIPWMQWGLPLSEKLKCGRYPVVLIEYRAPSALPVVQLDDAVGIAAAVHHLAELGHRRLLWLAPENAFLEALERRRRAFQQTVKLLGLEGSEIALGDLKPGHGTAHEIAQLRDACLKAWPRIRESTGVICFHEMTALGLYGAAADSGLRIPHDLSVIGFDDFLADAALPAMTTVSHLQYQIGRRAAELTLELVAAGDWRERYQGLVVNVPAELVIRQSTAKPRTTN